MSDVREWWKQGWKELLEWRDTVFKPEYNLRIDGEDGRIHAKRLASLVEIVAWLHMLTVELRKITPWEHQGRLSTRTRERLGTAEAWRR